MVSETLKEVIQTAQQINPDSIAIQAASDAIATATNPSPANILADVELAISLVRQLQALAIKHGHISDFLRRMF